MSYAERVFKENALVKFAFLCEKVTKLSPESISKICLFIEDEIELSEVSILGGISDE
jgi:hypothetical protein